VQTLTRRQLTAAVAARQMLLERPRLDPVEAIRRLTPLQGQHGPAPYLALAGRLARFRREDLEAALRSGGVVKTTIMRVTLHLAAAADYPAYAQLSRQARMRKWRTTYPDLDEARVTAALAKWLREPRSNAEIRERVLRHDGVPEDEWSAVMFARTLVPLVQVPPAGYWSNRQRPRFVADPRPLPDPAAAATVALSRYLVAYGPASRRDAAAWAGVAQRDFAAAFERLPTISFHDEKGVELLDLPDQPLPPASTRLPVRLLAHWDQALLAYADRERIIPPELRPLRLTLSGDPTVTVNGRVAASWRLERGTKAVRVEVTPHVEISRRAAREIRTEGVRTARICVPEGSSHELVGV
jgi:hypothetical protein